MPRRIYLGLALFCAIGLLLAGCGTAVPPGGKSAKPVAPTAARRPARGDKTDYSPSAVERRTEAHAHYAAGVLHDLDEEPESAAAEYLKAALADSGNESLVLEVSERLLRLKQNEQALELLTKATAAPGASGLLFARLGLLYSVLGKKEQAIEASGTAIKKAPSSLAGYRNLAQMYLQSAQYEERLKVLDQAAKQTNVDAAFLIELAELYTTFMRPGSAETIKPRALELLSRAAALKPANPLLLQKMADGFSLLGKNDQAAEMYLKLLARFPTLPGLREKLADLYLLQHDRKRATEQLEEIIRNNPTSPQAYFVLGSFAYEDSNEVEKGPPYMEKKLKEAVDYFDKTILLNPGFERVYYALADALLRLNKPQDTLMTLGKARDRFPQSFLNEYLTALAFGRIKEYTNAVKHFEDAEIIARATDTNRLTHTFYYYLGETYERVQKYDEAERYFKQCLALSPDFSAGLNYLGYMWADRGVHLAQAREMIEKAVKLEPKNAAFLDSLGWVLFKLEKPNEALPYMLKALENSKEPDSTVFDHLGDIYSSLHQADKAREAWRKAIKIEPNEQIQKKLDATATSGNTPQPP